MATGQSATVTSDEWQDYAPPKAKPASDGWQDYKAAPAPSGDSGELSEQELTGKPTPSGIKPMKAQTQTQFEKDREGEGYLSGLKHSLPALGSVVRRAAFAGFDPVSDVDSLKDLYQNTGERIKKGWEAGKVMTGGAPNPIGSAATAGAYAAGPLVGVDPLSVEKRAEHGDTAGIAGELTLPTVAALAPAGAHAAGKVIEPMRAAVGRTIAPADSAGVVKPGPLSRLVLGESRAKALGEILNPDVKTNAAHTDFANKVGAIEDARQKELSDQGRLRSIAEREEAVANKKGAKTLSIPNAATSAAPTGAAPAMPEPGASPIASTNPKVADMSALTAKRGKVAGPEEAEPPIEEGTIPVIGAPKPSGKGGKGGAGAANAPESKSSGSEGTAARWTNEYVMEQARKGDRTAIEQSARRGLPLPPNARYVMGDVDIPRVVLNPKEVTRFTPEGTPIRDMSRPETSSRERIQPAGGETIPPVEPLFQTPSMQVPSGPADTVHTGIHMDPVNPRVEGVLPGMEGDVARQAEGAAKVKGEDLTRQANTPKDINQAAGEMESKSPLFRGTAASPQKEIFAPGGESPAAHAGEPPTAEELSPEHVDLPKLKEAFTSAEADRQYVADEFHQGRATYKELQDAQKASEKAKEAVDEAEGTNEQLRQLQERLAKESERESPERIDVARQLIFESIDKLKNAERPGRKFITWESGQENTGAAPLQPDSRRGETHGGKWLGVTSTRETIPWLKDRKWGWTKLEAAMMSGKSKLYNEVMRAADDYLQGQTAEGRAANTARAQRIVASTPPPPPAKFASFQKPTRLTPPEEEPPF